MGDRARGTRLRAVPTAEERPPGRRRPGPAVLLVLFYGALFAAGLWWYRARSPLFRPRARPAVPARSEAAPRSAARAEKASVAPDSDPDSLHSAGGGGASSDAGAGTPEWRGALLAGEGLPSAERELYARQLSAECCTCGCDLTLAVCLARDRSCVTSPGIARKIRSSLR